MAILEPKTIKDIYDTSLTSMKPHWDNFDEYERIARNKPHPKVVSAKLPTVTDGTLAGVIASQPKRIIQQLPTGRVKSIDQPELAQIIDFLWVNQILENGCFNGSPLQKSWIMAKKALTYGVSGSYAFFKNAGDYYGADFSIPYIRDVILQPGKTYGPDCEFLFLRQWYTKQQIELIIEKEQRLSKRSADREDGETYKSKWNLSRLRKVLDHQKQKSAEAQTANERDKQSNAPLIEIIHCFQVGLNSKFFSYSPDLEEGKNIVRTWNNPDPRGKMPINFMYAEIDLSNPLGVGYAEMSGGMQNLLDSEVQRYQLLMMLLLNPPVMKWGKGIRGNTIKWKNNAVWDMGTDPNSKIEAVRMDNHAISQFVNNYGLIKSQILNLTNNQDSSVSGSTNANVNQSKTQAGVAQQQQRIGFDDNYMRKQFEEWWQANAETMINIHLAESSGDREIELTEEFLDDIAPKIQENEIVQIDTQRKSAIIAYDAIKTKVRFEVDATSSQAPDDAEQVQNLKEFLADVGSNPLIQYYLLNDGYELHLGEAYRDLVGRLGVAEIAKIITKLPKDESGRPIPPQSSGSSAPGIGGKPPNVSMNFKDMPIAGKIQAAAKADIKLAPEDFGQAAETIVDKTGRPIATEVDVAAAEGDAAAAEAAQPTGPSQPVLGPGDKALAEQFLLKGYSSQQALYAIELMHQGYSHDEILELIGPAGELVNG